MEIVRNIDIEFMDGHRLTCKMKNEIPSYFVSEGILNVRAEINSLENWRYFPIINIREYSISTTTVTKVVPKKE